MLSTRANACKLQILGGESASVINEKINRKKLIHCTFSVTLFTQTALLHTVTRATNPNWHESTSCTSLAHNPIKIIYVINICLSAHQIGKIKFGFFPEFFAILVSIGQRFSVDMHRSGSSLFKHISALVEWVEAKLEAIAIAHAQVQLWVQSWTADLGFGIVG